jgi:3'(2'), 5'-bisphosphate nucleotidase
MSSSCPFDPLRMTLDDHWLAHDIAATAGRVLLALRASDVLSGAARGAAGDAVAQALIGRMLCAARPGDRVLSEEAADSTARLSASRVWVVDPLDGTREFSDPDGSRSDWAVHVALCVDGHPQAAAVALPALGLTLGTAAVPALAPAPAGRLRIAVSRTRPPAVAQAVAAAMDAELVPMGSAGAKAMAVLRGEVHAYLHAGGLSEWDSCAPVGVALAAGLHATRLDGRPCVYNRADVSMPDLLICRPELATALLAAVSAARCDR